MIKNFLKILVCFFLIMSVCKWSYAQENYILSDPKYSANLHLGIKEMIQSKKYTYIKFTNGTTKAAIYSNDNENCLFILDPQTQKKYIAKEFNNIPFETNLYIPSYGDRSITFVIGFERIPDSLQVFDICEGVHATPNSKQYWYVKADFTNTTKKPIEGKYEMDYFQLNKGYFFRDLDKGTYIPIVDKDSIDYENTLKDKPLFRLSSSKYANYFKNDMIWDLNRMQFKGDLDSGYAIIQGTNPSYGYDEPIYVGGFFIKGHLNGYGKVEYKARSYRIVLEGTFVNDKLHGSGKMIYEVPFNKKEINCYFYEGVPVVSKEFGGIDENGRIFVKLNGGTCKMYPEVPWAQKGNQLMEYIYGFYASNRQPVYGYEGVKAIRWNGNCIGGVANGYGEVTAEGEKGNKQHLLVGSLKNGYYGDCKVYNFLNVFIAFVTSSKPVLWNVYKNGYWFGEDESEVNAAIASYSRASQLAQQHYDEQQTALSGNYELKVSKSGIANVHVRENGGSSIEIIDGGSLTSNVKTDNYSSVVYGKNGNVIKSYSSPFDDNYTSFSEYELPVKVVVSYYDFNSTRKTVELKIKKLGSYTLNIK